jgi:hypothetical protein
LFVCGSGSIEEFEIGLLERNDTFSQKTIFVGRKTVPSGQRERIAIRAIELHFTRLETRPTKSSSAGRLFDYISTPTTHSEDLESFSTVTAEVSDEIAEAP